MKMLRKASLGFNFTGSYKKNSVIVGKRLCHRCFSAIVATGVFLWCISVLQCMILCNQEQDWMYGIPL